MKTLITTIAAGAVALAAPAAFAADGKEIFAKACAVCHLAMPPKLGDKVHWFFGTD